MKTYFPGLYNNEYIQFFMVNKGWWHIECIFIHQATPKNPEAIPLVQNPEFHQMIEWLQGMNFVISQRYMVFQILYMIKKYGNIDFQGLEENIMIILVNICWIFTSVCIG